MAKKDSSEETTKGLVADKLMAILWRKIQQWMG